MEIRNLDDCFRFRLLRRVKPDTEKAKKSLEIARQRLVAAKKALKFEMFSFVILESYMAMFHASRVLLFKDGVQEKSHYAIFIYLKEKYSKEIPLHILNFLNIHRTERHETMYGLEYRPEKQDALVALEDSKVFVEEIEKYFKK